MKRYRVTITGDFNAEDELELNDFENMARTLGQRVLLPNVIPAPLKVFSDFELEELRFKFEEIP